LLEESIICPGYGSANRFFVLKFRSCILKVLANAASQLFKVNLLTRIGGRVDRDTTGDIHTHMGYFAYSYQMLLMGPNTQSVVLLMLQAGWLTDAVSRWLVDCLLPHDPYRVSALERNCPNFGLAEAAALWICAISSAAEADTLQSVEALVALVPEDSYEEQDAVLYAMAHLLNLSQACSRQSQPHHLNQIDWTIVL